MNSIAGVLFEPTSTVTKAVSFGFIAGRGGFVAGRSQVRSGRFQAEVKMT